MGRRISLRRRITLRLERAQEVQVHFLRKFNSAFHERSELLRSCRVPKFTQGLGLNLTNSFTGDRELPTYFFKGVEGEIRQILPRRIPVPALVAQPLPLQAQALLRRLRTQEGRVQVQTILQQVASLTAAAAHQAHHRVAAPKAREPQQVQRQVLL